MKKILLAAALLFLVPSVSFASIDFNLKYGQKNTEVSELQDFLVNKGFLQTNPTGFFGLLTLKAVEAYQTSVGISSTGYVGILTRTQINSELATATASSTQAEIQETGTTTPVSTMKTSNVQTPPIVSAPANAMLCNGIYFTKCASGQSFVCPSTGNAYCQAAQTTSQQNTVTPTPTTASAQNNNQLPSCATNGLIQNCLPTITISPTTVQGGATTTFTITTPIYRFGNDTGNTGYEACINSPLGNACNGYVPQGTNPGNKGAMVTVSPDGKTLSYTAYVPDGTLATFNISTNGLFNDAIPRSQNNFVNFSAGNVGSYITVNNSAALPQSSVNVSSDPSQPPTSVTANPSNYDKMPLMTVDFSSTSGYPPLPGSIEILQLIAHIDITGNGSATAAYIYDGSTLLDSEKMTSNDIVVFKNLNYWIQSGMTKALQIKVDVQNAGVGGTTVQGVVSGKELTVQDDQGNTLKSAGAATNTVTVTQQSNQ